MKRKIEDSSLNKYENIWIQKIKGNLILKAVDQQLKKPVWRLKDRSSKSKGTNDNNNKLRNTWKDI